jgi:DNA replication factor GINS
LDEFFQKLREIQKKERSISGLSRVGDNFYTDVSNYLNRLMRKIDDNPFSFESYLLRDAQRIVAEICERREHKIANSAVMNVQRAYQLFKESKSKDSRDDNQITVPINSTPEEEGLYLELVDSLIKYRGRLTAPLMSYIQKNQGNHGGNHVTKSFKGDKSLKSINIDELLSDAQVGAVVEENESKDKLTQGGDFENQIFERFGSEPSRKDKSKNNSSISGESDKKTALGPLKTTSTADDPKISIGSEKEQQDKGISLKESEKKDIKTLMILDELPSIVGVDKNVYGPVYPQDLITIPEPNARILVKNKKGIFIQTYK